MADQRQPVTADSRSPRNLADRRVLVTGQHSLALAVARWFVDAGAQVALLASSPALGSTDAPHVACSFADERGVEQAVTEAADLLGGIDQVVHAWVADGLVDKCAFMDIDEAKWVRTCEASLEGAWWLTRRVIAPLRQARGGSIVYLVPSVGLSGAANYSMLATVAEGIRVLAKGVGRQWVKHGVTANTIATAPGLWVGAENEEALARAISLAVPAFGRAGDATDDLAPLVSILADPGSHFISAATLVADGAVWMGL
ncbi:MAG TPA: SDR family oxidoreductase [Acidimicrobiales bacterium]|nr:SDR family oxidoreductase [Acidimicrobiales bacterium]